MTDRRISKKTFIRYAGKITLGCLQFMLIIAFVRAISDSVYAQFLGAILASQTALTMTIFAAAGFADHRKETRAINMIPPAEEPGINQ
jgi:hypothetical protein